MGARKYVIEIVRVSEGFLFQYIYLIQLKLPWTWYIMFLFALQHAEGP